MKLLHACLFVLLLVKCNADGSPFNWVGKDGFDDIMDKYSAINAGNCKAKSAYSLRLPKESVSMVPQANQLLDTTTRVFKNRTCLLALHDLSLSRAYFHSFMFKVANGTNDFWMQPGWQYYYWRETSFLSAFPYCINGTGIFYDYNLTYPNWIKTIPFNTTVEYFAPKAYRIDNTYKTWNREPSLSDVAVRDLGTGTYRNYTDGSWKTKPWYDIWLPDTNKANDYLKGSFDVGIKYCNQPGRWLNDEYKSHTFFGPYLPLLNDNENIPVKFTEPYFDCGHRNKWLVSASSPIVDFLPRYKKKIKGSRQRFVAVATMDIDFNTIDINPCPLGEGNPGPNIFAGIAKCKATTMCQPLLGWGFARGGYECVCRPGYRYPHWQKGSFQGADIELATEEEYKVGFNCIKVDNLRVVPSIQYDDNNNAPNSGTIQKREIKMIRSDINKSSEEELGNVQKLSGDIQVEELLEATIGNVLNVNKKVVVNPRLLGNGMKHRSLNHNKPHRHSDEMLQKVYGRKFQANRDLPNNHRDKSGRRRKRDVTDEAGISRMEQVFAHIDRIKSAPDCSTLLPDELVLPGDVIFDAKEQFEYQGRTALSMSHFLSHFIQNVLPYQEYGLIKGDNLLNPEQLHGEVLSHVMSDHKIRAMGIWFDEDQYQDPSGKFRAFFAPYAFQNGDSYKSLDWAGHTDPKSYIRSDWFRKVKMRWQDNQAQLSTFKMRPLLRANANGTAEAKFINFPIGYKAPKYELGHWYAPVFPCNGYVNEWVVKYAVPFFGKNPLQPGRVSFIGVVTVDVKLDFLDINQCPAEFWEPNAFKDTARCNYETTKCVAIEGKHFTRGAYRCECKQGYEYPFLENAWFFDGELVESEYTKKQQGVFSRFDHLRCRTAGASYVKISVILSLLVVMLHVVKR